MDQYFAFGHVLAPHTIYSEVTKLEPGCALSIGPDGRAAHRALLALRLRARARRRPRPSGSSVSATTFTGCVQRHLQSDVPLGAFLSGGVDSSAVVAAMSRVMRDPVRTFTIGFPTAALDEAPYARAVATQLRCRHTERRLELEDAATLLPRLATAYDEPFADPSAIPTWYVSKLAREQVTVALSGDGGDELFAGYERHLSERLLSQRSPLFALARLLASMPPLPIARWNYLRQRAAKISGDARLPSTFQRFFSKYQLLPRPARAALYRDEFRARLETGDELERLAAAYFPTPVSRDPVENLLYADTIVRLPDDMLTKVDRASMQHSLEVRVPFLSHVCSSSSPRPCPSISSSVARRASTW